MIDQGGQNTIDPCCSATAVGSARLESLGVVDLSHLRRKIFVCGKQVVGFCKTHQEIVGAWSLELCNSRRGAPLRSLTPYRCCSTDETG